MAWVRRTPNGARWQARYRDGSGRMHARTFDRKSCAGGLSGDVAHSDVLGENAALLRFLAVRIAAALGGRSVQRVIACIQ